MADSLNGYKVAILAVDGFEQAELVVPLSGPVHQCTKGAYAWLIP